MIVFNNYFKIVKKHLGLIILFAVISIVSSFATVTLNYNTESNYVNTKPKLAIIDLEQSKLTKHFKKYMKKNSKLVDIKYNDKEIQDALYSNLVDTVIIIPENFTKDFDKNKLKIKKGTDNNSEIIEVVINRYFKVADTYLKTNMPIDMVINNLDKDIDNQVNPIFLDGHDDNLNKLAIFFNFETYSFLSIFILIIGTIMCVFNNENIKKRNNISSYGINKITSELFIGHIVLTLIIWFVFSLFSFVLYKDLMFTMNGLLLLVTSLFFALTVTSLGYLVGSFVKNQNVIGGIQNVISLGLSFISGVFVPIELISNGVIGISKFFPAYWFVKCNNEIVKLINFGMDDLVPVFKLWFIILLFGLCYFIVSLIIKKSIKN